MPTERVYRTEAVILRRSDVGETDRLITLYTPHYGRLRVIAKGVRKPTSKLAGHLELFTHSNVLIAHGQNLDIITQAETLHAWLPMRDDLIRMTFASYLAELVDQFAEDHSSNLSLYQLFLSALDQVATTPYLDLLARYFELHLLALVGYQPELYRCVGCRKELEPVYNLFSASGGGVLCPNCRGREPIKREISLDALKVLRYLQSQPFEAATRLRLRPALAQELELLLGEYIRYHLERNLKSIEFLRIIRKQNP